MPRLAVLAVLMKVGTEFVSVRTPYAALVAGARQGTLKRRSKSSCWVGEGCSTAGEDEASVAFGVQQELLIGFKLVDEAARAQIGEFHQASAKLDAIQQFPSRTLGRSPRLARKQRRAGIS